MNSRVELRAGDTVFNIGLTGLDWPDAKLRPVAWKLQFLADDGHVLASEASYLWEKPAAKYWCWRRDYQSRDPPRNAASHVLAGLLVPPPANRV